MTAEIQSGDSEPERYFLVLEDDETTGALLQTIIEEEFGIPTRIAGDGVRALEAVVGGAPLGILVDLMVPRLDGEAFMHEVRARDLNTPFIVMSALAEAEAERVATLFNAPCLPKPFGIEALVGAVSQVLGRTDWARQRVERPCS
ncbi:MAG TPA: response regulator [Chloroflexota bacterium]|nr:response regulator [Chloroflexota bacterium]